MPTDSVRRVRHPRLLVLIGLLVLSFVFTAVLAYQAQDAARSHRTTAERTLKDYASFAAASFTATAKEALWMEMAAVLYRPADLGVGAPTEYRLPPWLDSALKHQEERCDRAKADSLLFFFRLDLKDRTLSKSRGCASAPVRAWIADTLPAHARTYFKPTYDFQSVVGRVKEKPQLVAYVVKRDSAGLPMTAYGFTIPFGAFAKPVFRGVMKWYPLLPPALAKNTPTDSLLSVVVTDTAGYVLYKSARQYSSAFTGTQETPSAFGGIVVRTTLRREAADKLVIGGLPRSRLPLLAGVLLVSAGLVAVAVQQLRREYELARLRADFISSISHELRTPLAQVRMFAETLLLGRVRSEEERRRSLQIIDQEARRLTHLVENVLQFSRSERRMTRLAPEPTEIASLVDEVVETFAPIAQSRRVVVRTQLIDGVIAPVDRSAFRQTLLNLLDNAVKYGPPGQTVTVGMTAAAGSVRITVDDEGPGIAPADRGRIWDPFYRCERDANSAVAGSGIGLAVVRELIAQHGGSVSVETAPSGGARFTIELQGARTGAASERSAAAVPASPAAEPSPPSERTPV